MELFSQHLFCRLELGAARECKQSLVVKMLDEATLHLKEAVSLGRTDILKTLLNEVKRTLKSSGEELEGLLF